MNLFLSNVSSVSCGLLQGKLYVGILFASHYTVRSLVMKLNDISQEKVFRKLTNSAVVMVMVVFF